MSESDKGSGPVKEFRVGAVSAAIWRNESQVHGRLVTRHSVKVHKRYFDKQEQVFRNSEYLFPNDLPRLQVVVQKAFEFCMLKESEEVSELPTVAS